MNTGQSSRVESSQERGAGLAAVWSGLVWSGAGFSWLGEAVGPSAEEEEGDGARPEGEGGGGQVQFLFPTYVKLPRPTS